MVLSTHYPFTVYPFVAQAATSAPRRQASTLARDTETTEMRMTCLCSFNKSSLYWLIHVYIHIHIYIYIIIHIYIYSIHMIIYCISNHMYQYTYIYIYKLYNVCFLLLTVHKNCQSLVIDCKKTLNRNGIWLCTSHASTLDAERHLVKSTTARAAQMDEVPERRQQSSFANALDTAQGDQAPPCPCFEGDQFGRCLNVLHPFAPLVYHYHRYITGISA